MADDELDADDIRRLTLVRVRTRIEERIADQESMLEDAVGPMRTTIAARLGTLRQVRDDVEAMER